jgi:RND superfamily putative drug exporter
MFDKLRWLVSRHPGKIVVGWVAAAALLALISPNLTRLAAEGQAHLLPTDAESARAAAVIRDAWPEQSYESLAVVALHRPEGRTTADRAFAQRLVERLRAESGRPKVVLRVLGPGSPKEVAQRLVSHDRTVELLVAQLSSSFVGPTTQDAVAWLQSQAQELAKGTPNGLEVRWSGDAVLGRDYMRDVQRSLDRAAWITIGLLLGILLVVYRSFLLALVPLLTIGISLVIARGALGWMASAGWEVSPLVELFLIVVLFGCGTDFCLFLSWRFGEHWNASNPAGAMRATLKRVIEPLLTSAGTVIIGLALMGTTRFKLFSSTGPSVALGLGLTVVACLTLTPALLILLARFRPRSFAGLTSPSTGFWDEIGHKVLARPVLAWLGTVAVLVPVAVVGLRSEFIQDIFSELPGQTPSVRTLGLIARKFGPGTVGPLTVLLRSDSDLRKSEGLALIDDVSRLLAHQRKLVEVRSATQPLGSTAPLEPARLAARLAEVNEGFGRMVEGAEDLRDGLAHGAGKLRMASKLKRSRHSVAGGLSQASSALLGIPRVASRSKPTEDEPTPEVKKEAEQRALLLKELTEAARGAGQIADGADRARQEITAILADPVGHRALDRLLITPSDIREHPELLQSFDAYISRDGKLARIDLTQSDRIFSVPAVAQAATIRRRLREFLDEQDEVPGAHAALAGPNAESADIWALTRSDQIQTWIIVPLGVFFVLLLTLRDIAACLNLVATMLLTYAFALGTTHLLFVNALGADGLDWKVPYFLFVLLVAVGVDYNVFLMSRLQEEAKALGLRAGINRAIAQTGGLISSAAAITACSFASFLFSPLESLRQLGFALVVGVVVDAVLVRPLLVPCGHWLLNRHRDRPARERVKVPSPPLGRLVGVPD